MPAVMSKAEEAAWFERVKRGQEVVKAALSLEGDWDSYECPTGYDSRHGDVYCAFCRSYAWVTKPTKYLPEGVSQIEHKKDCTWLLLRQAIDSYREVDQYGSYLDDEHSTWMEEPED